MNRKLISLVGLLFVNLAFSGLAWADEGPYAANRDEAIMFSIGNYSDTFKYDLNDDGVDEIYHFYAQVSEDTSSSMGNLIVQAEAYSTEGKKVFERTCHLTIWNQKAQEMRSADGRCEIEVDAQKVDFTDADIEIFRFPSN